MLEVIGVCLLLSLSVRTKQLNDRKKIEEIFNNTKTFVVGEDGEKKKCKFIKKEYIGNGIGTEYVYRLPLGLPYKKIELLNSNIGVFKDGLNKNIDIDFNNGLMILSVYETDLPEVLNFEEVIFGGKKEVGNTDRENVQRHGEA